MGENEIKDPREIGVSGLRGLNTRTSNGKDYIAAYKNFTPPNWKDNSTRRQGLIDNGPIESVGVEGFGESRYDKKMSQLSELKDLNESRANIQPWYDQIGAGILKGGVLATTTFADGVALNTLYLTNRTNYLSLIEANLLTKLITNYVYPKKNPITGKLEILDENRGLYIQGLTDAEEGKEKTEIRTFDIRGGNLGYNSYKLLRKYISASKNSKLDLSNCIINLNNV